MIDKDDVVIYFPLSRENRKEDQPRRIRVVEMEMGKIELTKGYKRGRHE